MKKKTFFVSPGVVSILVTGSILTVLTFQYFRWEVQKNLQQKLEEDAYAYTGMITNKVAHYVTLMLSLKNFFEFSATVTRDEFTGFTDTLLSQEPGLAALCWVPRVEPSQRQDYEKRAQEDGVKHFAFHPEPDSTQSSGTPYYPAYYVEPMANRDSLLGQILSQEPLLSETFEKVIKTGRPASVLNPLATIAQSPEKPESEYWIVVAVLAPNCTEQDRPMCLQGYLIGIIDVFAMRDTILRSRSKEQSPVKIHIEDVSAGKQHEFVCCDSDFDKNHYQVITENRFHFTDRIWSIYCVANEESPFHTNNAWMAWLVFPVGGLLTGLLVLHLYTIYCRNELADKLVEKRTRELREQKEKADTLAIEAERSSRAKSAFLAGMSHDIRTPMNVILGFCNLLAEETLSQDQKFYVNTIQSNSQNLLMLLNDILDLSKIEAGKLHIDRRDFDPQEILHDIELMFRVSTQNRGLEFRIISMNRVPRMIRSDPLRIRQCLVNLIGNAIKFTHQGHVYVSVSYEKEHLKLAVEDTGIGISQDSMEKMFDAFSPNGSGRDPDSDCGSDLGLAITRQLARLMGGDVAVQSELGKGSIFTLDIPAESAEEKYVSFQDAGIKEDGWGVI